MSKFLFRTIFFLAPVLIFAGFTVLFMKKKDGDLSRFVYLPEAVNYRKKILKPYKERQIFDDLSALKSFPHKKYKILTLGDSFAEKKENGFQQHLSKISAAELLHVNSHFHQNNNQFNSLIGLANGDFLQTLGVRYVIFEIVERSVYYRSRDYDSTCSIDNSNFNDWVKNALLSAQKAEPYPVDQFIKFPLQNIFYHLGQKSDLDQIRKWKSKGNMFSVNKSEVLFYEDDIKSVSENNKEITALAFNDILNKTANILKKKGITLIVLIAPDKFDFYYDDLIDRNQLPKPALLDRVNSLPKEYRYVDVRHSLNELKRSGIKDIYLYDDTHWSSAANLHIAKTLFRLTAD